MNQKRKEIFLPSLPLFCILDARIYLFTIPENKMGVKLPFILCRLPEWLSKDRRLFVFTVVDPTQTLQAILYAKT
jgi:hypothetical protein